MGMAGVERAEAATICEPPNSTIKIQDLGWLGGQMIEFGNVWVPVRRIKGDLYQLLQVAFRAMKSRNVDEATIGQALRWAGLCQERGCEMEGGFVFLVLISIGIYFVP